MSAQSLEKITFCLGKALKLYQHCADQIQRTKMQRLVPQDGFEGSLGVIQSASAQRDKAALKIVVCGTGHGRQSPGRCRLRLDICRASFRPRSLAWFDAVLLPDCKSGRRFAALISLPHRNVGGFDAPRKSGRIEQGIDLAVLPQLGFDCGEERRIARELERQSLILVERYRDQLGKSDRAQ